MANSMENKPDEPKKVAVACQGGGMHAAFAVGVLTEILKNIRKQKDTDDQERFKLVGLSGTSAGALCALMVWYGLAPKTESRGSEQTVSLGSEEEAIKKLDDFWRAFVAQEGAETVLNFLTYRTFWAEEMEIPMLGVNAPIFSSLNPYGAIFKAAADYLPSLGIRKHYFDLDGLLAEACPALKHNSIDWQNVKTRLLIGASEVVNGFEAVFDSDVKKRMELKNLGRQRIGKLKDKARFWRQRLPLSLSGVAASGTLPFFRKAEHISGHGDYWDGLYSQNPPVREFFAETKAEEVPDELWIVRVNPQQWPYVPRSNKDIQDRQNELMGNLSLHKELDFIMTVNEWQHRYKKQQFGKDHKPVTVRTIKMNKQMADDLSYSSKFDRSSDRMNVLRKGGEDVARDWLKEWQENTAGEYPEDAAYP
jgi:NTE family protein